MPTLLYIASTVCIIPHFTTCNEGTCLIGAGYFPLLNSNPKISQFVPIIHVFAAPDLLGHGIAMKMPHQQITSIYKDQYVDGLAYTLQPSFGAVRLYMTALSRSMIGKPPGCGPLCNQDVYLQGWWPFST